MNKSTVKIDQSKLLGFRLVVAEDTHNKNAVGAKVGVGKDRPAAKIGGKVGGGKARLGAKIGGKTGMIKPRN